MSKSAIPITVLILAFSVSAWKMALANDEASVLVEKKSVHAAGAPLLTPPTSEQTLPPPAKPATVRASKQPAEQSAKPPFMRPAEPQRRVPAATALAVNEEPMPAPEAPLAEPESPGVEVRPAPPIEYDTDGDARRMYRKSGQVELVMIAQNPADGCFYEIPMCIPACCTGEPIVSSGRGIFGRGVVEYCWECGFRAIVKFRHVLGDVKVEYEGD
ncbi:MAG: hypothetical protein L0228_03590 [Planctomycetes bacterium]|nr:hypothetical protein [Planctomycetota bacterium]